MDNSEKLSLFRKRNTVGIGFTDIAPRPPQKMDVSASNKRRLETLSSVQTAFPIGNAVLQRIVGASQDGSNSFVDVYDPRTGITYCDQPWSEYDGAGWIDWIMNNVYYM